MKTIKVTVDGTTNHRVKNPQTSAQTIQRIFILVVAFAYAKFKFIASHAFEGFSSGLQCMNKFRKVNLRYLRERAASLQNSGQSLTSSTSSCRFRVRSGLHMLSSSRRGNCLLFRWALMQKEVIRLMSTRPAVPMQTLSRHGLCSAEIS